MKNLYALLFLGFFYTTVKAQHDFLLYNMQEIPQSSYSNPANQFNGSFYIGLPGISSIYASFTNSRFAYSDIITKNGNSLDLDFDEVINQSGNINYLSFNSKIDLLSFGFKVSPKTQVMFNITENGVFRLNYTNDFLKFVYKGNAAFGNDNVDLEGLGINAIHYREYAFGISHQVNDKLRLGIKGKYLYGMENIYSEKTDINFFTDPETFEITANADLVVKTSGINNVDNDESTEDYLLNRDNKGFAIDLGGSYRLNEKITISGSLLDLGFINWKEYTENYSNGGSTFNYKGIEVDAFSDNEDETRDGNTSFDRVLDSLEEELKLDTTFGSYKSSLTSRFFLGGDYRINNKTLLSALFMGEVFQSQLIPAFSLGIHRKMTKWIGFSASYTIFNNSFNNLGFGINLNPGPLQIYIVSDNLLGAFQPQHARYFQGRIGINFLFGGQRSKDFNPTFQKREKKKKSKKKNTEE